MQVSHAYAAGRCEQLNVHMQRALQAAAFKSALGTGCVSAGIFDFQAASVAGHW